MRRVIVESPYNGATEAEIEANVAYARACLRDSLAHGEAPLASHLLYTQPGVLRDAVSGERQWGIAAGLAWGAVADATVVYVDRGVSPGMRLGIEDAEKHGRKLEYRSLNEAEVTVHGLARRHG
jgi:hypothetical protein